MHYAGIFDAGPLTYKGVLLSKLRFINNRSRLCHNHSYAIGCIASLIEQGFCGNVSINMGYKGDNCTILCNPGCIYEGNVTSEVCENTGSGSESEASIFCVPLNCTNLNAQLGYDDITSTVISSSCGLQYQSQCIASCDEGFTGDNVTYVCNVTSDSTMVDWVPIGGLDVMCDRGLFNITNEVCTHTCYIYSYSSVPYGNEWKSYLPKWSYYWSV